MSIKEFIDFLSIVPEPKKEESNLTKEQLYSKQYYQRNKSRILVRNLSHYHKNREKILSIRNSPKNKANRSAYNKEYYEKNKERIKEYAKEYSKNNRDKINARSRKNYAKRKKQKRQEEKIANINTK